MSWRPLLFLFLISPVLLRAQESYTHSELGITFPPTLAGMKLARVTNYEEENPGLGVGVSYRAEKEKADIYIYSNRIKNIPDGIESPEIQSHFKDVALEVLEAEKQGYYKDVKISVPMEKVAIGSLPCLHTEIELTAQNNPCISHIYLGVLNNRFFKIRYTYFASETEEGKKVLESLLKALGTALSPKAI